LWKGKPMSVDEKSNRGQSIYAAEDAEPEIEGVIFAARGWKNGKATLTGLVGNNPTDTGGGVMDVRQNEKCEVLGGQGSLPQGKKPLRKGGTIGPTQTRKAGSVIMSFHGGSKGAGKRGPAAERISDHTELRGDQIHSLEGGGTLKRGPNTEGAANWSMD